MVSVLYLSRVKEIKRKIQTSLAPSELVLNPEGGVYHLALHPHQLADRMIVVGDPGRVELISSRFDSVEHRVSSREFVTHTGRVGNQTITALSTGIGVDNIDIVLNELDALRNIDLQKRTVHEKLNPLKIVRLGTCGALNKNIEVGSFVHSNYALGLDGVMHYYDCQYEEDELQLARDFQKHTKWNSDGIKPYAVRNNQNLGQLFQDGFYQGITATACGFYGPQGRELRLPLALNGLNDSMSTFEFNGIHMANYEMESSALFGLGASLGHECTTVCAVIANRLRNEFLKDYHPAISKLIDLVLTGLTTD